MLGEVSYSSLTEWEAILPRSGDWAIIPDPIKPGNSGNPISKPYMKKVGISGDDFFNRIRTFDPDQLLIQPAIEVAERVLVQSHLL